MELTPYKGLSSETIIRYLYTGREYNIETGDYYYRYRVMDPSVGRFVSKDNVNALNRYFYADDDPVNWVDPTGLWVFKIGVKIDVAIGGWGFTGEVGIAFGKSKNCGGSFGGYVTSGQGSAAGVGASAGLNFGLSTHDSVSDMAGKGYQTSYEGSYAGWSFEVDRGGSLEEENGILYDNGERSTGFGVGVGYGFNLGGTIRTDTSVSEGSKGKCK